MRGHKVMLDSELAELYETETKVLNKSVARNSKKFPADFVFQLLKEEYEPKVPNWNLREWSRKILGRFQ